MVVVFIKAGENNIYNLYIYLQVGPDDVAALFSFGNR